LLLLCAFKVRLVATFLRWTTDNHPDPDDGHDTKKQAEPMCDSLNQSQNVHGMAPGNMALADPPEATLQENRPSADSVHVALSG
jgi:hypothetical protein